MYIYIYIMCIYNIYIYSYDIIVSYDIYILLWVCFTNGRMQWHIQTKKHVTTHEILGYPIGTQIIRETWHHHCDLFSREDSKKHPTHTLKVFTCFGIISYNIICMRNVKDFEGITGQWKNTSWDTCHEWKESIPSPNIHRPCSEYMGFILTQNLVSGFNPSEKY